MKHVYSISSAGLTQPLDNQYRKLVQVLFQVLESQVSQVTYGKITLGGDDPEFTFVIIDSKFIDL